VTETHYDGYFFNDNETTGLYPDKHGINEIACIRTDLDFNIKEYWRSYVKPAPQIIWTTEASEVSGIVKETVNGEPEELQIANTILAMATGRGRLRYAGFNCKFDLPMISALSTRTIRREFGFVMPWLCLLEVARKQLPDLPPVWNDKWKKNQTHTLELVCKHLGIDISGAHGAAFDIYATVQVARKLMR